MVKHLAEKAAQDDDGFLRGFGIAIGNRVGLRDMLGLASVPYIQRLSRESSYFAPAKWLSEIGYMSLGDEERAAARHVVHPDSKTLLKVQVLGNLSGEPPTHLDSKYLCNLIDGADALLLPAVCSAVVSVNNTSDYLNKLLEVASLHPALKPSVIAMLSSKLFDTRSGPGRAQIENLRAVYEQITDPEIKRVLLTGLLRISDEGAPDNSGMDFAKCHTHLANYNECILFGRTDESTDYDCLELIPISRSRQYVPLDVDALKSAIEDLAEKEVLPPLRFIYDAGSEEVNLQLKLVQGLKPLSKDDFHRDRESILRALHLAVQVYKKARCFRRVFGKAPFIHEDNLLAGESGATIVFRTLGMSLRSPYVVNGVAIGDEEEQIPRMIGMLLARLLVGDTLAVKEFMNAAHTGEEAFLALFITNMSSKVPADTYSCSRFEYMVEQLMTMSVRGEQQVAALYMRERLKGVLFRRNSQRVTWYGVSESVGEHVSHLRKICTRESLHGFAFRDRLALSIGPRRQLHWLSRQLLNLALNRGIAPTGSDLDPTYAALVEHLLLSSAISIEVLSLYRGVRRGAGHRRLPHAVSQPRGDVRVVAAGYERTCNPSELSAAVAVCPSELGKDATSEATELSLSQMMLEILLSFDARVEGDHICVCESGAISAAAFKSLAHACLVRIPRIEEDLQMLVTAALQGLRNNDAMILPEVGSSLSEDLIILARDFGRVRKHLRIRRCFGVASGQGGIFPDVMCRSLFKKRITAKESAIPVSPLTSKFPSSKYHCSWDMESGSVVNLVVPTDGLNALLSDLKAGKFFGHKLTYLYSGKRMLLYDLSLCVVTFVLLALCEYGQTILKDHAVWKSLLSAGSIVSKTIMASIVIKISLWDLGHWIPGWSLWLKSLRATNDRTVDSSEQYDSRRQT
jgi:hypothetical protein